MAESRTDQALRIFMWIVPRVRSTALLKCMGYVDDTVVWMEPYMSCHLNDTYYNPEFKKGYPPAEKMRAQRKESTHDEEMLADNTERSAKYPNLYDQEKFTHQFVKDQLEAPEPGKKFIFIKDQAFAIYEHLDCIPENVPTKHAFLIRHPREVYTSWKNVTTFIQDIRRKEPKPWDECHAADDACYVPVAEFYQMQYKLWKHVREHLDLDTSIIDSYDLTSNPEVFLPKLFEKWGIPFKKSYLEWKSDPAAVFSSWKGSPSLILNTAATPATARAVGCTKFYPPSNPRGVSRPEWKITDELKEYIEGAIPFYEEMYANRLF